ncbi:MAG: hypothetical protein NDF58_08695 [archaeon YNP-LCB-024-027]|nr:hypothetical protein [Candidatus Culexarchaeum yellowstonense]
MGDRLEQLVEDLVRVVKDLSERVEECNELLRVAVRQGVLKVRRGGGKKLKVGDLSGRELELLERFFEWARVKWVEWERGYEEGFMEGYDRERGWILLRKGTMNEFLDRVSDLSSSRQELLGLLGDLGVLRYWEGRGGKRQYCIAVRITKPVRGERMTSGYYVLEFDRLREVSQELRRLGGVWSEGGVGEQSLSD